MRHGPEKLKDMDIEGTMAASVDETGAPGGAHQDADDEIPGKAADTSVKNSGPVITSGIDAPPPYEPSEDERSEILQWPSLIPETDRENQWHALDVIPLGPT